MNDEGNKKNIICKISFICIFIFAMIFFLLFFIIPQNIKENILKEKKIMKIQHNTFIKGPDINFDHNGGTSILLDDYNIFVVGGNSKYAEIYHSKENKFTLTQEMNYLRVSGVSAVKLQDGNILITGGKANTEIKKGKSTDEKVKIAEIYNVSTNNYTVSGEMVIPRENHSSILLPNGNVVIIGGKDKNYKDVKEIEEYDYKTQKFKVIGNIENLEQHYLNSIVIPEKYCILFYGGWNKDKNNKFKFILYDAIENSVSQIESNVSHRNGAAVYIGDNKILLLGGMSLNGSPNTEYVSLIDLSNNKILYSEKLLLKKRSNFTATKLNNGQIILIGGESGHSTSYSKLSDTEKFYPQSKLSRMNTAMLDSRRCYHTAIKLKNGNIIIFGGYTKDKNNKLTTEIYVE